MVFSLNLKWLLGSSRDSDRLYIEIQERSEKLVGKDTDGKFSSGQDKNHNKVNNTSEIQTDERKLKINSEMQSYTSRGKWFMRHSNAMVI